ncbi:hypothetical protein CEUSTIGMA_g3792.t1 [Chlamydomonas eustigma]|uniref:Uncharacterized protein n=1 Tax=Chlamydomonas eustigma TaxID=1157962 RepID=A0A250WZX7_9CHLO|nr:hypothetical protein CEUSTIGMA_g3792.t1 [Chlamydomonas eustigma]|eukprot:GAX76346.1 hypothetical protein CEUSTIGMA_g3792.t1 [Chlamydomonas eustigma]
MTKDGPPPVGLCLLTCREAMDLKTHVVRLFASHPMDIIEVCEVEGGTVKGGIACCIGKDMQITAAPAALEKTCRLLRLLLHWKRHADYCGCCCIGKDMQITAAAAASFCLSSAADNHVVTTCQIFTNLPADKRNTSPPADMITASAVLTMPAQHLLSQGASTAAGLPLLKLTTCLSPTSRPPGFSVIPCSEVVKQGCLSRALKLPAVSSNRHDGRRGKHSRDWTVLLQH